MAKKTSNTVLFGFLGLAAVVAAGVGAWMFADVSKAKKAATEAAARPKIN